MTPPSLRLWRLVCIGLLGVYLWFWLIAPRDLGLSHEIAPYSEHIAEIIGLTELQQRRIAVALLALSALLSALLPFILPGVIGALTKAIRAADAKEAEEWPRREQERAIAEERKRAEEAARQWEKDRPAREAAEARAVRWAEARKRAASTARTQYPQYVDIDELEQRAWWDEGYVSTTNCETDLIETFLDPPEVVLKYRVAGEPEDGELPLYLRERVQRLETHEQVIAYRNALLAFRAECARRAAIEEQERGRERAEAELALQKRRAEEAAAEAIEREREERLQQQKIVRIETDPIQLLREPKVAAEEQPGESTTTARLVVLVILIVMGFLISLDVILRH
jgi:hypothetical protein